MFLGLVQAAVLGAALRVEGEVSCPAPAQVTADVQKILGLSDAYAPKVHATLVREGASIRLNLTESDGTSLGERLLDANEDCTVLSRAAAVVLAAWLTDQHPEFLAALPTSADATSSGDVLREPSSAPQGSPQAAAAAAVPAPVTPKTNSAQRQTNPAPLQPSHRFAVSAAIGGGWANSEFVPGAWLGVSLDPVQAGWGAQLSAAWLGSHTQDLRDGQVSWTRWPLLLGPYLRFATRFGNVELEAGPALGWLHLEGQNFSTNLPAQSKPQVGGYGALRFMPKADAWHPFLMLAPVFWFNSVTARSLDSNDPNGAPTATTHLSSLEVLFTAGLRFLP